MSQSEARAWWAEVEHLRERLDGAGAPSLAAAAGVRADEPACDRARRAPHRADQRPRCSAPVVTPRHLVEVPRRHAAAPPHRRPAARADERAAHRPDRIALWAVLLGLALVLVATTSANAATSLGDRTLHVPMRGHDVRELQQQLAGLGLLSAAPTAYYGRLTRSAVRRYQRPRCLTADGIAGPATSPRCATARRAARARVPARACAAASSPGTGPASSAAARPAAIASRTGSSASRTARCRAAPAFASSAAGAPSSPASSTAGRTPPACSTTSRGRPPGRSACSAPAASPCAPRAERAAAGHRGSRPAAPQRPSAQLGTQTLAAVSAISHFGAPGLVSSRANK